MNGAALLQNAWRTRATLLSVGLEPCPEYLPVTGEFDPSIAGYERFLMAIVEGGAPSAAAFKFNTAFFEALGPDGWALLKRVRDRLPRGTMVIVDSKRGDIGSTAKHYAQAAFDWLGADAVTLNPLMGRDSAEPFLAYPDKLCFFLCLTSNPGSADFLRRDGLYLRIAREVSRWGGCIGLVVGATQPQHIAEIRAAAPGAVFLIPGIGAQGGEVESVASACLGGPPGGDAGPLALFHVTRGVLPDANERAPLAEIVRRRCGSLRERISSAWGSGSMKERAHA